MLTNYHTHCNLCKHAGGTIEEYVLEAVDKGFDILGMSDHLPYKDVDYGYRMEYKEKDIYFDEITRLKEKYKKDIKLYSGMESEQNHSCTACAISFLDDIQIYSI